MKVILTSFTILAKISDCKSKSVSSFQVWIGTLVFYNFNNTFMPQNAKKKINGYRSIQDYMSKHTKRFWCKSESPSIHQRERGQFRLTERVRPVVFRISIKRFKPFFYILRFVFQNCLRGYAAQLFFNKYKGRLIDLVYLIIRKINLKINDSRYCLR